jgi:hypothetical protein
MISFLVLRLLVIQQVGSVVGRFLLEVEKTAIKTVWRIPSTFSTLPFLNKERTERGTTWYSSFHFVDGEGVGCAVCLSEYSREENDFSNVWLCHSAWNSICTLRGLFPSLPCLIFHKSHQTEFRLAGVFPSILLYSCFMLQRNSPPPPNDESVLVLLSDLALWS